jgi:hypothetical protein
MKVCLTDVENYMKRRKWRTYDENDDYKEIEERMVSHLSSKPGAVVLVRGSAGYEMAWHAEDGKPYWDGWYGEAVDFADRETTCREHWPEGHTWAGVIETICMDAYTN